MFCSFTVPCADCRADFTSCLFMTRVTATRGQIIEAKNRLSVGGHADKHLPLLLLVWSSDPGEKLSRLQIRAELQTPSNPKTSDFILGPEQLAVLVLIGASEDLSCRKPRLIISQVPQRFLCSDSNSMLQIHNLGVQDEVIVF